MRLTTIWLAAMLFSSTCPAQARDQAFVHGYGYGTGDLLDSPVIFEGGFYDGSNPIEEGHWSVEIPDEGWPADPDERSEYIWSTFFAPNYHGFSQTGPSYWTGLLHVDSGLADFVQWHVQDDTNGGSVGGIAPGIEITVYDLNGNGLLEPKEFSELVLLALPLISVQREYSEGCYYGHCGDGCAYGVWWAPAYPAFFGRCDLSFYMWLDWCPNVHPRDEASWGTIKAMFR